MDTDGHGTTIENCKTNCPLGLLTLKLHAMKKRFFACTSMILFLFAISTVVIAQENKGAELTFSKEQEDIGQILTSDVKPYSLEIEFENSGNEPLIISNVRGCCGTRIKDYPKEPVMPGEKANVTVEFRLAPRPHRVSRTVSIMSNDADGMKVFRIRGEVIDESAAENSFGTRINTSIGPRVE